MVTLDLQNLLVCRNILKDKLVQELAEAASGKIGTSLKDAFIHDMKKLLPALSEKAVDIVNVKLLDD